MQCQLRTGDSFASLVYFGTSGDRILMEKLSGYSFTSDSGSGWRKEFCSRCATTLEKRPELTAISYRTCDPPTFYFFITREVFTRSKAHSQVLEAAVHHEAIVGYDAARSEDKRLSGKANETKL